MTWTLSIQTSFMAYFTTQNLLLYALCLWMTVISTKKLSYNSLRSATGDFHPSSKIGGGGYGVVYKVRVMSDHHSFFMENYTLPP